MLDFGIDRLDAGRAIEQTVAFDGLSLCSIHAQAAPF